MGLTVKDAGGVLRAITSLKIKDGTTTRNIAHLKIMDGGTLRTVATFASGLSLSVAPAEDYKTSHSADYLQSNPFTATPSGGLAPYSYAWTKVSGGGTLTSTATAQTRVSSEQLTGNMPSTTVIRCTCTDAAGQTATADAQVTFYFFSLEI